MELLKEVISIVEKKISEKDLKYKFQKELEKKSVYFEIESNENVFVLVFWENGSAELTKLNKDTSEISCDVFESIDKKKVNDILKLIR